VIIDGHTRSAIMLSDSNFSPNAAIKATVLIFPSAKSFFDSYRNFREEYQGLSVEELIRTAAHKRKSPTEWERHPEACPGVKPVKKK